MGLTGIHFGLPTGTLPRLAGPPPDDVNLRAHPRAHSALSRIRGAEAAG